MAKKELSDKELIDTYLKIKSIGGIFFWLEGIVMCILWFLSKTFFSIFLIIGIIYLVVSWKYGEVPILEALHSELIRRGLYKK